ncbi:iron ABC transporter permease, partial [Streptomyces kunmingensis]
RYLVENVTNSGASQLRAYGLGAIVGFVAFVSPPIARRLVPGQGAALLPSAAIGALLVIVADFAGHHLIPGTQLPVGIVTSVIGAPYLLWLLARANRAGRGG